MLQVKKVILAILMALFGCFSSASGGSPDWIRDLEQGKKVAKKTGKNLMVVFTGHGWCGHCIDLDREVFTKDAFLTATKDRFVFVELDYTFGNSAEEKLREKFFDELKSQYAIAGFPTVVLMDKNSRPFADFVGYDSGYGQAKYLRRINQATKDYQQYVLAESTPSLEDDAAALVGISKHMEAHEGTSEELFLLTYASLVKSALPNVSEESASYKTLSRRLNRAEKRKQLIAAWEAINEELNRLFEDKKYIACKEYLEQKIPTIDDMAMKLRLQKMLVLVLERADLHEQVIAKVKELRAQKSTPNDLADRLLITQARSLRQLDRYDELIALYDDAIKTAGESNDKAAQLSHLNWKMQLLLHSKYVDEIIDASKAIREISNKSSKDWSEATFFAGLSLFRAERFSEALKFFDEFHANHEPTALTLNITALSLLECGKVSETKAMLDKMRKMQADLEASPRQGDREDAKFLATNIAELRAKIKALEPEAASVE